MTFTTFIILLCVCCTICVALTEAIKKACENAGKKISNNVMALINAVVVGGIGTVIAYVLMGIRFDKVSIICLVLMVICVWMGSMNGYDKIVQTVNQIKKLIEGGTE